MESELKTPTKVEVKIKLTPSTKQNVCVLCGDRYPKEKKLLVQRGVKSEEYFLIEKLLQIKITENEHSDIVCRSCQRRLATIDNHLSQFQNTYKESRNKLKVSHGYKSTKRLSDENTGSNKRKALFTDQASSSTSSDIFRDDQPRYILGGLRFGDFEDLSPEENERILHILHGQKNFPARVEFPWDGETDLTEEGNGMEYSMGVEGATSDLGSQSINYQTYSTSEFTFGTVHMSEITYGLETRHIISFDDENHQQSIQMQSDESGAYPEDRNTQSKLQASLKPYERRNKKKRPPDYYKEQTDDSQSQQRFMEGYGHSGVTVPQEVMSQQSEFQTYSQNHPMMYSDSNNTNMHLHGEPVYMAYEPNMGNEYNAHSNPTISYNVTVHNDAGSFNNQVNQQPELHEIVVDVNNTNYTMPARTETYQIQDHIRTNPVQVNNDPNYTGVGNMMPYPGTNEGDIDNQINTVVTGSNNINFGTNPVVQGITVPNSSSQQQIVHSVQQFNTAESVHQPIPEKYIASDKSHSDPQTIVKTSGNDPDNKNKTTEVNTSATNMDKQVSVNTDSNVAKSSINSNSVQPEAKPKSSWASLFKSSASSTTPQVISDNKSDSVVIKTDSDQVPEKSEKEFSPIPVPAKDDSIAKELGEMLSQITISHASAALQPRGLVNKGNWCYINGTLQALIACPPFYNLLKKMPKYTSLSRGPSSTPILDSLVEFVHEFRVMPRPNDKSQRNKGPRELSPGPPFEPSYVYRMLQAIAVNPDFKLGKQEDAEEFLSCILDGTHEEMAAAVGLLNKQTDLNVAEGEEGYTNGYYHADEEEELQDDENWEQVGPKKKAVLTRRSSFAKTPIADIFAGMIRSGVYKASAKETATLEPFFTLQLDIQSEKVISVRDALEGLVSKEVISGYTDPKTNTESEKVISVRDALEGLVSKEVISGYTDPKTNAEVEVVKKLSLEELPPVLILHLKFFVYNKDGGSQKLMKRVDYPVELEITKDLLSQNARNKLNIHQRSYKLFAVVYHHGKNMTGGHYTTCVFHPGINGWVLSDDSTVKPVHVSTVLKYSPPRVPYLLYYRRLDSH